MASSSAGPPSFGTQADALLRKNLTYQKRNVGANVRLIIFPVLLCVLISSLQRVLDNVLENLDEYKCGCICLKRNGNNCVEEKCGIEYSSTVDQAITCPIPNPIEWPPLLQVPAPEYSAVKDDIITYADLPEESCRFDGSCPAVFLLTGANRSFGELLGKNMFPEVLKVDTSNAVGSLAAAVIGSYTPPAETLYLDPAFATNSPLYSVQSQCKTNPKTAAPVPFPPNSSEEITCVQGLNLWRNSPSEINDELYKGYRKGNSKGKINEITAAYDFLDSDLKKFNVSIWYNSTYKNDTGTSSIALTRVPRSVNLASNAYLLALLGPGAQMLFDFVKEVPKPSSKFSIDLSSLIGPLFFTWVVLQLLPVVLKALVYEKQQRLRIMMKMHGLGDGPYWLISYAYFLALCSIYMLLFVIFGSIIGLKIFTLNSYSIQFVFYFIYINLQIALPFLLAAMFSTVKTAAVVGYILVFGTGLLAAFLFQIFVENRSFPRIWIVVLELFPGFSLFRGLYELGQYASRGSITDTSGMKWSDLADSGNGMKEILIIMPIEWLMLLALAYYLNKTISSGGAKGPLFFLQSFRKKPPSSFRRPSLGQPGSKVCIEMEKPDVIQEREKVQQLLLEQSTSHPVICNNLRKIYPPRDGNPEKIAVRGLSLGLPSGECFGMLGPNGAGKTSFICMMVGITKPTSGMAFVDGLDIQTDMEKIYTRIGVCPQDDLLWETLTGREHLLFYGRLKNLKGPALTQAVEESLKSVNLFHGGVADKAAGKYSGGMKRRLSVAISLIGDPKVVYLDEPSTGLDPASRNNLWNVVKDAKRGRAIVLTTHSMEEAEALCDRLGIFVDGSLQCIGNPKELKARYGGSYVFTITTSEDHEAEVESMIRHLSPNATRIYRISGTQKFELPKHEVRIASVFQAVEDAKTRFTVFAWGLADTNLEDVFIKVARGAEAFNDLS